MLEGEVVTEAVVSEAVVLEISREEGLGLAAMMEMAVEGAEEADKIYSRHGGHRIKSQRIEMVLVLVLAAEEAKEDLRYVGLYIWGF